MKECNANNDNLGGGSNNGNNGKRALFDINVKVLDSVVREDKMLLSSISLINFGNLSNVNVSLLYQILDRNSDIVHESHEEVSVDTQKEFIKEIDISGLKKGEYELIVNLEYPGQTEPASSVEMFIVGDDSNISFILIIIGIFLAVLGGMLVYFKHTKLPKKVMKIYQEIHSAEKYKKKHDAKHLKSVYIQIKKDYNKLDDSEKEEIFPKISRIYDLDKKN